MSYDSSRVALYTVLNDGIGATIPIRFDTISEDDNITMGVVPWVRCYIDPIETSQHSIGTSMPLDRTVGQLIIEIYCRESDGFADIYKIADTISDLYRGKTFDNGDIFISKVLVLKRDVYMGWNSRILNIVYTENKSRAIHV